MTETAPTKLNVDLTDEELDTLDDFLASPALEDTAMDASALECFLTALAIGPRTVIPSEWMPWIRDMDAGEATPEFEHGRGEPRVESDNAALRHRGSPVHGRPLRLRAALLERRAAQPEGFTSSRFPFGRGPQQQVVRNAPR